MSEKGGMEEEDGVCECMKTEQLNLLKLFQEREGEE
jgi:hypothetical protein